VVKNTHIRPKNTHTPFSHYSHAVIVENPTKFIFCAGQVAGDPDGKILGPDDFDAQGELVMANLKKVLAEAGAKMTDVVKLVSYVCSPHDVKKVRALVKKHFPHDLRPQGPRASRLPARDRRDGRDLSRFTARRRRLRAVNKRVQGTDGAVQEQEDEKT
jgi:enamine deaminase RidA (YjgF/YER057c/UK114 family)